MPIAALVLAAALWGLATTGTKYALGGFAPVTLLTVELLAATVMLWIVLLARGYRRPRSGRRVLALGLLEPAAAYLAQTFGLAHTDAAGGAVLLGLESVFVVVLALVVLRERVPARVALAIAVALAGLVVLEQGAWSGGPQWGDGLMLAGALSAACYTIVARGLDPDEDALALTAHQFAVASVALLPVTITLWHSGIEPAPTTVAPLFWLVAAAVGIAGFGASFLLYNYAIATVPAASSAVIINLIPAFGFVGAITLLGESITWPHALGAAMITGSVFLVAPSRRWAQLTMISADKRSSSELVPTYTSIAPCSTTKCASLS